MKKYLFLILVTLASCTPILKMAYGIKNPEVENKDSIIRYLDKKNMNSSNIYAYDFESFKIHLKDKNSIPDVYIYNSNGEYIPYGDDYACNASAFDFVSKLDKTIPYQTKDIRNLNTSIIGLTDLDGTNVEFNKSEKVDFYVLIYWTVYIGKLNKDHVKIWEEQANNNTKSNIKVLKINMDFQENWGEDNIKTIYSE